VRKGLEPRRLASGAVVGGVIGVMSILMLGSEGPKAVFYVGVALMVLLTAPWILSVLYLRTERGRVSRHEYLARREHSRGHATDQRSKQA
jgi:peptidoglycan/LPS O-acetylase OafA/YrhL